MNSCRIFRWSRMIFNHCSKYHAGIVSSFSLSLTTAAFASKFAACMWIHTKEALTGGHILDWEQEEYLKRRKMSIILCPNWVCAGTGSQRPRTRIEPWEVIWKSKSITKSSMVLSCTLLWDHSVESAHRSRVCWFRWPESYTVHTRSGAVTRRWKDGGWESILHPLLMDMMMKQKAVMNDL